MSSPVWNADFKGGSGSARKLLNCYPGRVMNEPETIPPPPSTAGKAPHHIRFPLLPDYPTFQAAGGDGSSKKKRREESPDSSLLVVYKRASFDPAFLSTYFLL